MKKFSASDKQQIEQRILAATGLPLIGVHPEFFLRPDADWPRIANMDNSEKKFPHLVSLCVQFDGDALCMSIVGVN